MEDSAKGGGGGGAKGELNRRDIVKISENYNIEIKSNLTGFFCDIQFVTRCLITNRWKKEQAPFVYHQLQFGTYTTSRTT